MSRPPQPILDRLSGLHPKRIDLSLGRIERLLARLDHPQRNLPPIIHVAGTNGKGSVIATLRAMHAAAGRSLHVYTSPHLVRFNERIVLAGTEITDAALSALLEECETANAGAPITFFEITTVAAMLGFARTPADLLLLEVGLGGRLDTTNVIERPIASAITPVSIDHTQFLGDTLAGIAAEKAGILRPGVPAVIGPQPSEAAAVIADHAARTGTEILCHEAAWSVAETAAGLDFRWHGATQRLPRPKLPGAHQIINAGIALAVAALTQDAFPTTLAERTAGLTRAIWPARLQHLRTGPLFEYLPADWELWLDGGHNAEAGQAMAAAIRDWRRQRPGAGIHLIAGMLNTKAAGDYLRPFAGLIDSLQCVVIPGEENSLLATDLAAAAEAVGVASTARDSLTEAFTALAADAAGPGRVLICGSLYLAGFVLAGHS